MRRRQRDSGQRDKGKRSPEAAPSRKPDRPWARHMEDAGDTAGIASGAARARSVHRPPGQENMLYGVNPVLEALEAGMASRVYIYSGRRSQAREIVERATAAGIEIKVMHDAGFFDSRFPKGHQGVAADLRGSRTYSVEDLMNIPAEKGEPAFFLLLDGIEDPRNLGAVLRSAEAAGVHGVVMEKRRSAPIGPEAIKASAGAALHVPMALISNIKLAMRAMKDEGIRIIGAEAGGDARPWSADMTGPLALVAGSEGRGLRRTVSEACDIVVSLPIMGKVNSLNTSVAAGIIVYEVLRQRGA